MLPSFLTKNTAYFEKALEGDTSTHLQMPAAVEVAHGWRVAHELVSAHAVAVVVETGGSDLQDVLVVRT